ncbi:MAG: hypothetical protein K5663_10990 [Clostridiales bacterium]|nr:hypothetical protein [Clostridiales bacterium]
MRYKLSWRMGVDELANTGEFEKLLDMMNGGGQTADEIWIFIAEPTSSGYEPLDEIARKCELYRSCAAIARARGIRVGINPWPTFGAGESYQAGQGQPSLPYQGMVGLDGSVSARIACPISPEFLAYTKERYKLFAKAGCDFVWVDDDCRFTHLGGVRYPCFCPRCVQGFEGGRFKDRESLVKALNTPENADLRRKWSAYGAERLAVYCRAVREAVDEVDPSIETPFMSVGYGHTTYAGDFIERCMKALRAKSARPGHGFYWDETPMELFEKAYEMSRQVVDVPSEALDDVQYEEESCPRTPLNKAPDTRLIEMAVSVWGGCTGVAMNHMYYAGGKRPFAHLEHEIKLLRDNRAFLDRYLSFARDLPQSGLWGAYSKWMMSAMKVGDEGWFNEHDKEYSANRFTHEWPVFGIPVTADPRGAWGTLLQGRTLEAFSDDEISIMLEKPVVLDGLALETLWERGFGEHAGAKVKNARSGGEEKLAATPWAGEFAGSCRSAIFDKAYDLELTSGKTEVLAYTSRPYGQKDEVCAVKCGDVVTLGYNPYRFTGTPGHMRLIRELFKTLGADIWLEPTDEYDVPRVAVFARADEKRAAVLLINAETSETRPFDLCLRGKVNSAVSLGLNREDIQLETRAVNGYYSALRIDTMKPWEMAVVLVEREN